MLAGAVLAAPASAATIAVNTTVDDTTANGNCTLREAVIAANTDTAQDACAAGSGADTINVPGGLYSFSATLQTPGENQAATGDLDLLQPVTIAGAGAASTTIDANQYDRVFDAGANVGPSRLTGMTIENGKPTTGDRGGAVFTGVAAVTLQGDVLTASQAGGGGGGIYGGGPLTVRDSTISHNSGDTGGGGAEVSDATFDNVLVNANDSSRGAGIYVGGSLTMTGGQVSGNGGASTNQGGGIEANNGTLSLTGTRIDHNHVHNVGAGLFVDIRNNKGATLTRVEIDHNDATSATSGVRGGGIADSGHLDVVDSFIHDNAALPSGSQSGTGGGIWFQPRNDNGADEVLAVTGSTIAANSAAAGDGVQLEDNSVATNATFTRTTIAGNGADTAGGLGGGLAVGVRETATLRDVTLAENKSGNAGGGGNLYIDSLGDARLRNTLITRPFGGGDCEFSTFAPLGTITKQGGNAEYATSPSCGLETTGGADLDPVTELRPLANNGGPTPTLALRPGSPPLNKGAGCQPTDQRGVPRPPAACDPGAYELDVAAPQSAITGGPTGTVTDATVTFDFSADESATFACSLDGGAFASCTSPFTAGPLANGPHTFGVRATDVAGNQEAAVTRSFTVAPPAGGTPNPGGASSTSPSASTTTSAGSDGAGPTPGVGPATGPGGGGTGGGTGAVTALGLSPKAFKAARRGGSAAAVVGTTVRFTVSGAASVSFSVQRPAKKRKKGKRSKPRTLRGAFARTATAGANTFRFTGRVGGKALKPGRYVLVATGPGGKARTAGFRIVR